MTKTTTKAHWRKTEVTGRLYETLRRDILSLTKRITKLERALKKLA